MLNLLLLIFVIGTLLVLIITGMIIYQLIRKRYKYKIRNLLKLLILFIVICFISVVVSYSIEVKTTGKQGYIDKMNELAQEQGIITEYNYEDNMITIINSIEIYNDSFDEYLIKYLDSNEEDKARIDMKELKESCIELSESIIKAQDKFNDASMNVVVKVVAKNDNKNIYIIKNGEIEYDVFEEKAMAIVKEDLKKEEETSNKIDQENIPLVVTANYKAKFGEVKEANALGKSLTIKFKIEPSYNNEATINQNSFNVEDLILNQKGDQYETINYWAVADMEDGSEGKVISFTLDKELIEAVKNRNLIGKKIVERANDVWILPSLK